MKRLEDAPLSEEHLGQYHIAKAILILAEQMAIHNDNTQFEWEREDYLKR
jgi:hypothetical protein